VVVGVNGVSLPCDDAEELVEALEKISTLRRQRAQSVEKEEDDDREQQQEEVSSQKKRKHKRSRK
jgi:hypothetical protein